MDIREEQLRARLAGRLQMLADDGTVRVKSVTDLMLQAAAALERASEEVRRLTAQLELVIEDLEPAFGSDPEPVLEMAPGADSADDVPFPEEDQDAPEETA